MLLWAPRTMLLSILCFCSRRTSHYPAAHRSNGRSGSAPPTRHVLRPRVEAAREGQGSIHDSLFADAKEKRKVLMQREAEYEQEIEAKSRSNSAHRLRPEALNRLCYGHRQKEVCGDGGCSHPNYLPTHTAHHPHC